MLPLSQQCWETHESTAFHVSHVCMKRTWPTITMEKNESALKPTTQTDKNLEHAGQKCGLSLRPLCIYKAAEQLFTGHAETLTSNLLPYWSTASHHPKKKKKNQRGQTMPDFSNRAYTNWAADEEKKRHARSSMGKVIWKHSRVQFVPGWGGGDWSTSLSFCFIANTD